MLANWLCAPNVTQIYTQTFKTDNLMKNNLDNIDTIERAAIRKSRNGEPFVLRGRKYHLVPDPEGVSQTQICAIICAFGAHNESAWGACSACPCPCMNNKHIEEIKD